MMETHFTTLLLAAASIGIIHTVLGPDHYLPFVALAKAGQWSRRRTILVTALCGVGHVGASVVLALIGVGVGWAVGDVESVNAHRGEWAAWALMAIGLVYGIWGVRQALRGKTHTHKHVHVNGTIHAHTHEHDGQHAHAHADVADRTITPWLIFIVFVLGPCEALIPLLMVPAAAHDMTGLVAVVLVFGSVTILSMLAITLAMIRGLDLIPSRSMSRWAHALAGLTLVASGAAVQFLGL